MSSSSSSSSSSDGDAGWREAIDSVAATTNFNVPPNHSSPNHKPTKITHYQIQAQKLLDDIVENSIEIVKAENRVSDEGCNMEEGGIRLFKCAPLGIKFDHVDELKGPTKKPRILQGPEIDEKSKKFRCKLESVAVDGLAIIAAASAASKKAQAKVEAKHETAKAASKREEERVAALKKIRGERWLPSMAKKGKTIP